MNKLLLTFALSGVLLKSTAQDLVVTPEGDSLNCKITKVKNNYVYFTFVHQNEVRNTLLPVSQVAGYQYNYFDSAILPVEYRHDKSAFPRWRLSFNGGFSYRLGKLPPGIDPSLKPYLKDLKSGAHYEAGVSYYFSEQLGAGLRYNHFLSKASADNIYVTPPNGQTQYGSMSDNIGITWFGPLFSTRLLNGKKTGAVVLDVGIGYAGYRNKSVLLNENLSFKGGTAGLYWGIGYDIGLSKGTALGLQFGYTAASLTKYRISNGFRTETIELDKDNYESLSHIDLSVGLRFGK